MDARLRAGRELHLVLVSLPRDPPVRTEHDTTSHGMARRKCGVQSAESPARYPRGHPIGLTYSQSPAAGIQGDIALIGLTYSRSAGVVASSDSSPSLSKSIRMPRLPSVWGCVCM